MVGIGYRQLIFSNILFYFSGSKQLIMLDIKLTTKNRQVGRCRVDIWILDWRMASTWIDTISTCECVRTAHLRRRGRAGRRRRRAASCRARRPNRAPPGCHRTTRLTTSRYTLFTLTRKHTHEKYKQYVIDTGTRSFLELSTRETLQEKSNKDTQVYYLLVIARDIGSSLKLKML